MVFATVAVMPSKRQLMNLTDFAEVMVNRDAPVNETPRNSISASALFITTAPSRIASVETVAERVFAAGF